MDLERELEHKSHLLEEGVGFLKTLGRGGASEQQTLKPDPVRALKWSALSYVSALLSVVISFRL